MKQSRNLNTHLPALAFGERAPYIDHSVYDMRERLKFVLSGVVEYESLICNDLFRHHCATLTVNRTNIVATASTPVKAMIGQTNKSTLLIPLFGRGDLMANGNRLQWQASQNAVFLPNFSGRSHSTDRSILMIGLDLRKLESVALGMLGISPCSAPILNLDLPREIKLHVGGVSFEAVFRQLAHLLDHYSLHPELLNQSGMEDSLYRNIAVMMDPKLYLDASTFIPNESYTSRLLDRVRQYAQAHLLDSITLSDLEQVSCMSRRKLHYSFLLHYGCTPMQWVRSERLKLAQNRLQSAIPGDTLSKIAMEHGFTKLFTFSNYYLKQFGELPSTVITRALAR